MSENKPKRKEKNNTSPQSSHTPPSPPNPNLNPNLIDIIIVNKKETAAPAHSEPRTARYQYGCAYQN